MTNIVESFSKINSNIKKLNPKRLVNIIAVSKTFSLDYIMPLIDHGHMHFGENKVQEATAKLGSLKKEKKHLKLHMVGKLQSHKAKNAGELFDYIHSLDTQKLADVLSNYELNSGRNLKYFIQVNIGNELQKSGIPVSEIENFYDYCINEKKLDVQGLMVIPPNDNNTKKYFKTMNELNISLGLKELSMGMSSDYEDAVVNNSTFVRIGSLIFGKRS